MNELEREFYNTIDPFYGMSISAVAGRLAYKGVTRMQVKRAFKKMVGQGLLVSRLDNDRLEDVYYRVDHVQSAKANLSE